MKTKINAQLAQQDRNVELNELLRRNLNSTTRRGGRARASTRIKGDSAMICVGLDREGEKPAHFMARNLRSGWKVDSNTTGYGGTVLEILEQLFAEAR